jgi:hypothetical protein
MALPISQKRKTNRRSQREIDSAINWRDGTSASKIGIQCLYNLCGLLFGLFLEQGNSALCDIPQPENISHLVPPNRLADQPVSRAQCSSSKGFTARCAVGQFQTFSSSSKIDYVLSDNVTSSNGVHSNLILRSRADDPETPMLDGVFLVSRF